MYQCSEYVEGSEPFKVLIASPHGSIGEPFFEAFKDIAEHTQIQEHWQTFKTYLKIEQDYGANELSHRLASALLDLGIPSMVMEMEYPRAIVDGGRVMDHCLRNALPLDLESHFEADFRKMHQKSLAHLSTLHEKIQRQQGLVIDMHTMASFSPMNDGKIETQKESFEGLKEYCEQFLNAPKTEENMRYLDIITEDGNGNYIADRELAEGIALGLKAEGVAYKENIPYYAYPAFLMHTHLTTCPGVAIDVPKHYIASYKHLDDFMLDCIQLDLNKIDRLVEVFANAIKRRLDDKT